MASKTWSELVFATLLALAALMLVAVLPKPAATPSDPIYRPLLPLVY